MIFHIGLAQRARLRNRTFYVCCIDHEHDRIYAENLREYFNLAGLRCEVVAFQAPGQVPELRRCLAADAAAVIGFNSQLDHCWFDSQNYVDAAASADVPVIHWILDHPSSRWPEFTNPNSPAARFLLVSDYCARYLRRNALPHGRLAAICGVGANRRSRIADLTRQSFLDRPINCLIALNVARIGGTREDLEARIERLDAAIASVVREAIELARFDLAGPLETHLDAGLARRGITVPSQVFHECAHVVEDMTQIWRRLKILEVASRFPVRIQTDVPPTAGATASFHNDPGSTSMASTFALMKSCRAVLGISLTGDMIHDRTANGLNAGCVSIVEDSAVHRRVFVHGRNGLLFRYDDDSLAVSLDIVCSQAERAYEIARRGFDLRDRPEFRFNGFHGILELAS